jgi:hypothetical protein
MGGGTTGPRSGILRVGDAERDAMTEAGWLTDIGPEPKPGSSGETGGAMGDYEYTVVHAPPAGILLMPWASQAVRDAVGRGSFEKRLNRLADEGWEVVSFSTATEGAFLWLRVVATVLLRRARRSGPGGGGV